MGCYMELLLHDIYWYNKYVFMKPIEAYFKRKTPMAGKETVYGDFSTGCMKV
jgi:hypothetical protein